MNAVTMKSNNRKPPTAPPAYRPQPVPRVMQAKQAVAKAPPVYRPQPTPHVAQRKILTHGPKAAIQAKAQALPRETSGRPPVAGPRPLATRGTAVRSGHTIQRQQSRTIQRQKADAQAYADTNGLGITANHITVMAYVTTTANPKNHRQGLLDAWNLNNARWAINTPPDLAATTASTNPYSYQNFQVYKDWTNTTSGVTFQTPFGTGNVSAFHNQGAPKLGSNKKDWDNADVGDKYIHYVAALRSGGLTDQQIATALLNENGAAFQSMEEKRAAAMIFSTVYLAEEWRKQGAAKVYRAMMRAIAAGTRTFDHFLDDYKFIPAAQSGREMVGRFYNVFNEDAAKASLSATEQVYYNCLSPAQTDDWSSDDELRKDDKKNLKSVNRLTAKKHTS